MLCIPEKTVVRLAALSPALFGLYVYGLEKHLLATADIDAPTLTGVTLPLLLYAHDLTLMSESAAGLQKHLDALPSFCDQRQLTVNLSKTKVVVFEGKRCGVQDYFTLNGAVVERVDSYKYLGFVFHAVRDMAFGAGFLVAAARKALFAMRRRCAWLGIRDLASQCKLFDTLVLPILSYGCEVWGVNPKLVKPQNSCTETSRRILKRLLGVRKSTMNGIVLAELGHFPLQIHFWQQTLRFHHRALALGKSCLVKLAFLEGATLGPDREFLFRDKKC